MKILLVLLAFSIAFASGCTARNYYEGLRLQQEMQCEKQPGADRDECSKQSGMSYDEYQRQLKESRQDK